MRYIHQLGQWPLFTWDAEAVAGALSAVRFRQGLLVGRMESLSPESAKEVAQAVLLLDAYGTRAIEERKDPSSAGKLPSAKARSLRGSGEYAVLREILEAPETLLTAARLDGWHRKIIELNIPSDAGSGTDGGPNWRSTGSAPKQIVYGPLGWEKVQFVAPEVSRLPVEMSRFLAWINFRKLPEPAADESGLRAMRGNNRQAALHPGAHTKSRKSSTNHSPLWDDGLLRAALAHLWFITLHPYHDGSGRLARAITDLLLHRAGPGVSSPSAARERNAPTSGKRFYSLSERLYRERSDYFAALRAAQQGGLDVTPWLDWFLHCLERAMIQAEALLAPIIKKDGWRKRAAASGLNKRQALVFETMLSGFPREISTRAYARMAETSQDTAFRDIARLIELGLMRKSDGGGRSTAYRLKWAASAPADQPGNSPDPII